MIIDIIELLEEKATDENAIYMVEGLVEKQMT